MVLARIHCPSRKCNCALTPRFRASKRKVNRKISIRRTTSMWLFNTKLQIRIALQCLVTRTYTIREWLISVVLLILACLLFDQMIQRLGLICLDPAT